MTDWDRLRGMTCTCPPACTTGKTWGDGPRDCNPTCQPCQTMGGTAYTKPGKPSNTAPKEIAA